MTLTDFDIGAFILFHFTLFYTKIKFSYSFCYFFIGGNSNLDNFLPIEFSFLNISITVDSSSKSRDGIMMFLSLIFENHVPSK